MAAVPQILKCNTAKEYATVLQQMLSVLNDAATYASIENGNEAKVIFTNTERGTVYRTDSLLVMRINDKAIADDWNETVEVTSKTSRLLDSAAIVLFDLRVTARENRLANPDEMNFEFITSTNSFKSLNSMLSADVQSLPAERYVVHEGFKPEGPGGSEYAYQSYFRVNHSNLVTGRRQKPCVLFFC